MGALAALAASGGVASAQQPWFVEGHYEVVKDRGDHYVRLVSDSEFTWPDEEAAAAVGFVPRAGTTFADLSQISVDYRVVTFVGGGTPRFSVGVQTEDEVRFVHIYLGEAPNWTEGPSDWQNTGNLLDSDELRFDTSQVGGTFYDSYESALELVGDLELAGVLFVVDGGWTGEDQVIDARNFRVNNFQLRSPNFAKN